MSLNARNEDKEFILGPGDTIAVKFFYNEKLNEEIILRPDGRISLQLVGDIEAAGLTPDQLDALLTKKYAEIFKTSHDSYNLSVGDRITVKLFYNSELNEEVIIRPDGRISLQLIGDIDAAGLTPTQLDSSLTEQYSKFLDNPEVAVLVRDIKQPDLTIIVNTIASQKVYVGGEVAKPGLMPIGGMLRTLDAVIQAGGPLNTAEVESIIVIRYNESKKPETYLLNMSKIINGEIPDMKLRSYDIVYVPKSKIAKVNQFVKEYIFNMIPPNVFLTFPYELNPSDDVTVRSP
jgi:protein involved in polysaccharide export with SLBB domain